MRIRRRELLAMVATALTGCSSQKTPGARRQTPEEKTPDARRQTPEEKTPDARRQTPTTTLAPAVSTTQDPTTTTTPAPVRTIEVIERAGWGAAEPGAGMVQHTIERLTIHHTGVELGENRLAPARLRAHQEFHQTERRWPDLAYHFAIDRAGNIYEGRSPGFRGDTATTYDPAGHLLIVLEGNFDIEATTEPQLGSLTELLAWAAASSAVSPDTIKSHRDYTPGETSCPGANIYSLLLSGNLVDRVASVLSESAIEMIYLRGTEALDRVADIESP